jgi:transketolase
MRKAFMDTLVELARKDERIFLLTGDLGFSVLEEFRDNFPRRFFNMGVAEQNMIGVAAGLALSGKIVFVYSIIPFVTMRCFEQIRNDLCFQNLDVRLVGIGAGLTYGPAGATHHAVEDVAIMRSLVNMTVLSPGDPVETRMCVRGACYRKGPVYIRLGKGMNTPVHSGNVKFSIGKGIILREGRDLTLIASGSMLSIAAQVCENLAKRGLSVRFLRMPTIKPLDRRAIVDSAKKTKAVFTVEEHSEIGGIGSAAADALAESKSKALFRKFALKDIYRKTVGSRDYLLRKEGLSEEGITESILNYTRKV